MIQSKTTVRTRVWNQILRVKVGNSVTHNNGTWINRTGINSEPVLGSVNWELVFQRSNSRPIVTVFGNEFILVKHPLNNDPSNFNKIQNDDFIIDGFRSDNIYWRKAICLDESNINEDSSWDIVDTIGEEEVIIEIGGIEIPVEGIPVTGDVSGTLLQDGIVYDSLNNSIGTISDNGFGLEYLGTSGTFQGFIGSGFFNSQTQSIEVFFGS